VPAFGRVALLSVQRIMFSRCLFARCADYFLHDLIRMLYQIDVGAPPKLACAIGGMLLTTKGMKIPRPSYDLKLLLANSDLLGAGDLKMKIYYV
jgi:hypothetical protein